MPIPAERFATYEDLCQVPDRLLAQIVHGQLIVLPRPAPKHALASSALGGSLYPPMAGRGDGPGGWWILFEPELHLSPHILVPDLEQREIEPSKLEPGCIPVDYRGFVALTERHSPIVSWY